MRNGKYILSPHLSSLEKHFRVPLSDGLNFRSLTPLNDYKNKATQTFIIRGFPVYNTEAHSKLESHPKLRSVQIVPTKLEYKGAKFCPDIKIQFFDGAAPGSLSTSMGRFTVEPYWEEAPHCSRCQDNHHDTRDCPESSSAPVICPHCPNNNTTKCSICALPHQTRQCPKIKDHDGNLIKQCVNCSGPKSHHTSNYKGCPKWVEATKFLREQAESLRQFKKPTPRTHAATPDVREQRLYNNQAPTQTQHTPHTHVPAQAQQAQQQTQHTTHTQVPAQAQQSQHTLHTPPPTTHNNITGNQVDFNIFLEFQKFQELQKMSKNGTSSGAAYNANWPPIMQSNVQTHTRDVTGNIHNHMNPWQTVPNIQLS